MARVKYWADKGKFNKKGGQKAAFFKGRGAERSLAHPMFALTFHIGHISAGL
jgi:hypothetical protein